MEFAQLTGEIELRAAGRNGRRRLRGRFKYKSRAVLSDGGKNGGRPAKEEFLPGAFSHSIHNPDQQIHLLVGHDFSKPLASKNDGTLTFDDTAESLNFDAEITPEISDTSYGADLIKQIDGGMELGVSPGFRIPPRRAVPVAEKFTDEGHDPARGMFNARIRTIIAAVLYEMSIVTRPAYPETVVKLDAFGNALDPEVQKLLEAGWTINADGILVPPTQPIIKRAMPAALRWR
jgi:HK97 family phage prohead protease